MIYYELKKDNPGRVYDYISEIERTTAKIYAETDELLAMIGEMYQNMNDMHPVTEIPGCRQEDFFINGISPTYDAATNLDYTWETEGQKNFKQFDFLIKRNSEDYKMHCYKDLLDAISTTAIPNHYIPDAEEKWQAVYYEVYDLYRNSMHEKRYTYQYIGCHYSLPGEKRLTAEDFSPTGGPIHPPLIMEEK